jgi:hypothetical protein
MNDMGMPPSAIHQANADVQALRGAATILERREKTPKREGLQ